MDYEKKYILRQFSKEQKLKKVELEGYNNWILDCEFYETKYENIYITDYDLTHFDLESRGLVQFFYRKGKEIITMKISIESLCDVEFINQALEIFKKETL